MAASAPPSYETSGYNHAPPVSYSQGPVYSQAPPPTTRMVVETAPLIMSVHAQPFHWGEIPQRHTCQFCGNQVVTEVVYETGTLTWLAAGGLCLLGCWLGCCAIPFFVDSMKDPVHICPACRNIVGKKSRI